MAKILPDQMYGEEFLVDENSNEPKFSMKKIKGHKNQVKQSDKNQNFISCKTSLEDEEEDKESSILEQEITRSSLTSYNVDLSASEASEDEAKYVKEMDQLLANLERWNNRRPRNILRKPQKLSPTSTQNPHQKVSTRNKTRSRKSYYKERSVKQQKVNQSELKVTNFKHVQKVNHNHQNEIFEVTNLKHVEQQAHQTEDQQRQQQRSEMSNLIFVGFPEQETVDSFQESASSGEAANLQNRLRSLSTGLVGLRNSLHENGILPTDQQPINMQQQQNYCNIGDSIAGGGAQAPPGGANVDAIGSIPAPHNMNSQNNSSNLSSSASQVNNQSGFDGFNTIRSARSHVTEVSSVMTGNVSDQSPNSTEAANKTSSLAVNQQQQLINKSASLGQLSPPMLPASNASQIHQHNYCNVTQPAPMLPKPRPVSTHTETVASISVVNYNQAPSRHGSFGAVNDRPGSFGAVNEAGEGAFSRSAVRPRTPPAERLRKREKDLADEAKKSRLAEVRDLIHLSDQPVTEDLVTRALQARFFNQKYYTNVGPIVLALNPYKNSGNPLTLTSTKDCPRSRELNRVIQDVIRLQGESGYPQAIIVSGESGSGKTYTSMCVLRQLFEQAGGGGAETDTFKHLAASFTVLRSLGSAKTAANRESSRIGHFIEVQVSDGALYRTKIHCYFLDQSRVVKPSPMEKNYHIFYQMLAGLTKEERVQLGLGDLGVEDLQYLNIGDTRVDTEADALRFAEWKSNLAVLGIPFMDVVRVLAAILLLGNVDFAPGQIDEAFDVEVVDRGELEVVSGLLGIPSELLRQGLTSRTHSVRGQPVNSMSDANLCTATRNALAKALYCRTVATIARRANSLKRPVGPLSGTMSSDSNESVIQEVASHHASTIGTAGSKKSNKSMAILNNAVRHATDGFIGILDMFGFEDAKPSQLEQLCINLCSETMQHFYNTHIFKSSMESCREEGIQLDVQVDYVDNVPVIDLISSLRTGLLSMLDVECSLRGLPETYVQKVKIQHKENKKLYEAKHCDVSRTFGIQHYAGQVVYDSSDFLDTNRDVIPDDLVRVFGRGTCDFGFATHLFGNEIKTLLAKNQAETGTASCNAAGVSFRIAPTSHPEMLNGDEPVSTLTQDFHTRLDNLLRTLVHAKPHFVRCIKPNEKESESEFDRNSVLDQIRALQVIETVNLMSAGFPHRMRFKAFNARYRILLRNRNKADFGSVEEESETILNVYSQGLKHVHPRHLPRNTGWAHGRKHVFLSEGARQQLENMRQRKRNACARTVQKAWRNWRLRRQHMLMAHNQQMKQQQFNKPNNQAVAMAAAAARSSMRQQARPRPQPIAGTPPPESMLPMQQQQPQPQNQNFSNPERCDFKVIQQTCALFGLDLERPPPIPPSRNYTVQENKKISFPQSRIMKYNFPDPQNPEFSLSKNESVMVIGVSSLRGHFVVERKNHTFHVPYKYLDMKPLQHHQMMVLPQQQQQQKPYHQPMPQQFHHQQQIPQPQQKPSVNQQLPIMSSGVGL